MIQHALYFNIELKVSLLAYSFARQNLKITEKIQIYQNTAKTTSPTHIHYL